MNKLNCSHRKTNDMEQMREDRHGVFFKFVWGNTSEITSPSLKNQYNPLSAITDLTATWLLGDLPGTGVISQVGLSSSAASWYPSPFIDTQTQKGKKNTETKKGKNDIIYLTRCKFCRKERISA